MNPDNIRRRLDDYALRLRKVQQEIESHEGLLSQLRIAQTDRHGMIRAVVCLPNSEGGNGVNYASEIHAGQFITLTESRLKTARRLLNAMAESNPLATMGEAATPHQGGRC